MVRPAALLVLLLVLSPLAATRAQDDLDAIERDFRATGRRAAPRDAFPVFDHPELAPAVEGDRTLRADDWVIGVELGGEAKAYPVAVMGVHELGNDTCGGVPIAVAW